MNFAGGQTVADLVTVPVAADGTVTLYDGPDSTHLSVELVADVAGYTLASSAPPNAID